MLATAAALRCTRRLQLTPAVRRTLDRQWRRDLEAGNGRHHRHHHAFRTPPHRPLIAPGCSTASPSRTIQTCTLFTTALPSILVPPTIFIGLLLALWTYKCLMSVLFQDKIIYMPYMPPFARKEKIADYGEMCRPVVWEEVRIRSLDSTHISLCVGTIPRDEDVLQEAGRESVGEDGCMKGSRMGRKKRHVVICYFQGNGSSTPPRLPLLSQVLKLVHARSADDGVQYSIVALSYRGYWTSSGRASQRGIELDAQAMLRWVARTYSPDTNPDVERGTDTKIVLWGQSIGAGIASTAAATYLSQPQQVCAPAITGLIMETPFTSVKSMLLALYPQKWLPYQYLHPFLWNHWDSEMALRKIADASNMTLAGTNEQPSSVKILLMPATRDEVVPPSEIIKLESHCKDLGLEYERKDVMGALHTEASMRREGQDAIARFVVATTVES